MIALSPQISESFQAPQAHRLFKTCAEVLGARTDAYRNTAAIQPNSSDAANAGRLEAILGQLGLAANPVAIQCLGHVNGATERAIANISDWMTYLPPACVSSMVRDGWHWST